MNRRQDAAQQSPARAIRVTCDRATARGVVANELQRRGYREADSCPTASGGELVRFHWSSPLREAVDDVLAISVLRSKLIGGPHGFGVVTVDLDGVAPSTVVTVALRKGVYHATTVREVIDSAIAAFAEAGTLADPGVAISSLDLPPA
ncbi:hypothetical protein ACGIF2_02345 [Cellulomonas sp. P22]|uniref:hypothetical protein n=1 Tax=Cellulomonas sp. P22 TaxID=3373189 RepID=UPI003788716F